LEYKNKYEDLKQTLSLNVKENENMQELLIKYEENNKSLEKRLLDEQLKN
jgi:hypothetical protein